MLISSPGRHEAPAVRAHLARKDDQIDIRDLFGPPRPVEPTRPKPGLRYRVNQALTRGGPLGGVALGAGLGVAAAQMTGGALARTAGIAAGVAAAPVAGLAGVLGGLAVTLPLRWMGAEDLADIGVVVSGIGGLLASPVLGYMLAGTDAGTWLTVGSAVAAGAGGLALGWMAGDIASDSSVQWEYEDQLRAYDRQVEQFQKDLAEWKTQRAKLIQDSEDRSHLSIQEQEDFVVVGDVAVDRNG